MNCLFIKVTTFGLNGSLHVQICGNAAPEHEYMHGYCAVSDLNNLDVLIV